VPAGLRLLATVRRPAPLTLVLSLILAGAAQARDFPEGFL
jgi:hypothetical protein